MIRLAPISVPIHRRLETFSVLFWLFLCPAMLITLNIFCLTYLYVFPWVTAMFGPYLFLAYLGYLTYVFLWDKGPKRGGRQKLWFRKLIMWKWYRDYFPVQLVRDDEENENLLEKGKNYLFGYHPHGVIGIGAHTNFVTESNMISSVFPNHKFHVVTLNLHFNIPIWREVVLALGFISADRKSIEHVLTDRKGDKSKVVVIVLGGAEEALEAHPDTNDLIIRKRRGFFRLALKTGSSVVPVYSFGENDLYRQVGNEDGSLLKNIQLKLRKWLSFSTPIIIGRGVLNYDFGILPQRRRIATVIGNPIAVTKIDDPTDDDIKNLQEKYIEALINLYNRHKETFNRTRKRSIRIIG